MIQDPRKASDPAQAQNNPHYQHMKQEDNKSVTERLPGSIPP